MGPKTIDMLVQQILALAWIRCVMEEGVDFVNKRTGKVEKDERVIYEEFERRSGIFDLPAAKGSRYGLEKNILEVIGGYVVHNDNPTIAQMLASVTFKSKIKAKLQEIVAR